MKHTAIRSLVQGFLAASLLIAANLAGAQSEQSANLVALHILPDTNSPVYTEADISALDRFNPQPVITKNFVGQGWESVFYRGNYIGFVRNGTLAGNYVRPGTVIYMGPTESAPQMQTLQSARQAFVNRQVNGEWSEVTFNGVIPLYFIRSTVSSPISASNGTPILAGDVARVHLGKLERVSAINRLFGSYDYQLTDAGGTVIAYVDITHALYVGRIEDYWNKWVTIEGLSSRRGGSVPLVIDARFISLN